MENDDVDFFVAKLYQQAFPHIALEFKGFPYIAWEAKDLYRVGYSEMEKSDSTIQLTAQTLKELAQDSTRLSRLEKLLTTIIDQDDLTLDIVIDALEHDEQGGRSPMVYTDPIVGLYGKGPIHFYEGEIQRLATACISIRES